MENDEEAAMADKKVHFVKISTFVFHRLFQNAIYYEKRDPMQTILMVHKVIATTYSSVVTVVQMAICRHFFCVALPQRGF